MLVSGYETPNPPKLWVCEALTFPGTLQKKQTSKNVSKNVCEALTFPGTLQKKQTSKNDSKSAPENVSKNAPENVSKNAPENVSKNAPENVSKNPPENVSKNAPENVCEALTFPGTLQKKQTSKNVSKNKLPRTLLRTFRDI